MNKSILMSSKKVWSSLGGLTKLRASVSSCLLMSHVTIFFICLRKYLANWIEFKEVRARTVSSSESQVFSFLLWSPQKGDYDRIQRFRICNRKKRTFISIFGSVRRKVMGPLNVGKRKHCWRNKIKASFKSVINPITL